MDKKRVVLLAAVAPLFVVAGRALATDVGGSYSTSQTWSGNIVVTSTVTMSGSANLTIQPGTTITFADPAALITFSAGSTGTLSAVGTQASPIQITGNNPGTSVNRVTGFLRSLNMQYVNVSGMGNTVSGTAQPWMDVNTSTGTTIKSSTIANSGKMFSAGGGVGEISGNTITNLAEVRIFNSGIAKLNDNKIQGLGVSGTSLWISNPTGAQVKGNVILNGSIRAGNGVYVPEKYVIENNYIRNLLTPYGLNYTTADIRNNIIRGCGWSMSGSGGKISGNVLESLTPAEAAQRGDATHENILQITDGTVIERNLFLNSAYGSIMGIGDKLLGNVVVRNNTFDGRSGATNPVYLNHLPTGPDGRGLNVRNNLFLRTGVIYDETPKVDTISYVDYNAWAGTDPTKYTGVIGGRFKNVTITGKSVGDDGFGMHDVIVGMGRPASFDPADIVQNPDFVSPYSDADMLAGTYTLEALRSLYFGAYAPVSGSPVINVGSPADAADPLAMGRIDIGAVEAIPEPAAAVLVLLSSMGLLVRRRSGTFSAAR